MSDINKEIEGKTVSDNGWNGDSIWAFLLFSLFGLGWNNSENPKISGLEKKVARLEGQMSMIGGKLHE